MKVSLVSIGQRRGKNKHKSEDVLVAEYLKWTTRFVEAEGIWVETEDAFWLSVRPGGGRQAKVILMDVQGSLVTSPEFAEAIEGLRDRGAARLVVGIGGANGWAADSLQKADMRVSMGRLTLPHGLARVVAAEQIYRAMTILAGHPYHCGH